MAISNTEISDDAGTNVNNSDDATNVSDTITVMVLIIV